MASRVDLRSAGVAVVVAVVIGVAVGLGIGWVARSLDWSTALVGPVTGALVGGLVPVIYRLRSRRSAG